MGQNISNVHSEDTLDLFNSISGSVTSVTNSYEQDVVIEPCENKKTYQPCSKLTQIKRSLSEYFRSKFRGWRQMKNDSDNFEEIPADHGPMSDLLLSGGNDVILDRDLPRDIHEIHEQLRALMQLLIYPQDNGTESDKRNVSCQTDNVEDNLRHMLRQRDVLILNQEDMIRNLQMQLTNKSQIIEKFSQEPAVLKAQQARQRIDIKNTSPLVTFLRDIRDGGGLVSSDILKMDEVIEYMTYAPRTRNCPLDNVAVINPCSNSNTEQYCFTSQSILVPLQSDNSNSSVNPFVKKSTNNMETKLICFLDHSVTPYISNIPISASGITLSDVKNHTKSVLPKNTNYRYIFRSTTSSCEQTQEEIYRDTDQVPVQDNKIMVRIRM